jgi:GNAT superfamily N-acetyltransferase
VPDAPEITIRAAVEADVDLLLALITELATFEKLADEVVGTPEQLRRTMFEEGAAEAILVEAGGETVGYAIFYTTFSTFECRPGIWMEDLYVRPEHRGGGTGRRIVEHLAALALEREYVRLDWCALDWNPAMEFYDRLGAASLDDWTMRRLEVDGMRRLAGGETAGD